MRKSKDTLRLVNRCRKEGKWVACICAATIVLVQAIEEAEDQDARSWRCQVTSHPSVKDRVVQKGWEYSEERVVVDKKTITSRG